MSRKNSCAVSIKLHPIYSWSKSVAWYEKTSYNMLYQMIVKEMVWISDFVNNHGLKWSFRPCL